MQSPSTQEADASQEVRNGQEYAYVNGDGVVLAVATWNLNLQGNRYSVEGYALYPAAAEIMKDVTDCGPAVVNDWLNGRSPMPKEAQLVEFNLFHEAPPGLWRVAHRDGRFCYLDEGPTSQSGQAPRMKTVEEGAYKHFDYGFELGAANRPHRNREDGHDNTNFVVDIGNLRETAAVFVNIAEAQNQEIANG